MVKFLVQLLLIMIIKIEIQFLKRLKLDLWYKLLYSQKKAYYTNVNIELWLKKDLTKISF